MVEPSIDQREKQDTNQKSNLSCIYFTKLYYECLKSY